MPLVGMPEVLAPAEAGGFAVGAINVANLETTQAVIGAAEELGVPVIVQIFRRLLDNGVAAPVAALTRCLAARSSVPVCLHLDHGQSLAQVEQALALGFTSVMIDGSTLDYAGNVSLTQQSVLRARAMGCACEAELGTVPVAGASQETAPDELTDPDTARRFVADTGVDLLAVAIGNAHGFYQRRPQLDFARAAAVRQAAGVPLVLHGGSDLSDDDYRRVIDCGVRKINLATEYQATYIDRLTAHLNVPREGFKPADVVLAPVTAQLQEWLRGRLEVFRHA